MKSTNHEGRKGQNRLAHSIAGLHEVVRPRTILVVLIAIAACATVGTAYAQTLIDSTVQHHFVTQEGDKHQEGCEDRDRNGKSGRDHDDAKRNEKDRHDDDDCVCKDESQHVLELTAPGVSLLDSTTLLSAVTIVNSSTRPAHQVNVDSITLTDGTLTSPVSLPVHLGTLAPGASTALATNFSGGPFTPEASYTLRLHGTFRGKEGRECFDLEIALVVPPAAPGSGTLHTTTVGSNTVKGAPFPQQNPTFGDQDNGSRYTVPTGPLVAGTPTMTGTTAQKAPIGDPGAIDFTVNNDWNIAQSSVAEPSGASGGGVVFVTSNWFAAYSTDGGGSFTQLNPTTIFPNDAVGFCCDQIVQYVPSIDRFIWLLQGNGMRLASASPADVINSKGTAWTYWNLTPDVFGEPAGTGFDYPDLAVGTNSLYLSWDAGWPSCPKGCNSGREVVRTSLSEIQASSTIFLGYTTPSDSNNGWGDHLSQDTGNEIFWAGHNSTSSMRIYSLMEGSNTYFWQDVGISSWSNSGLSSTTPDGQDWMSKLSGFPGTSVIGLTRSGNQVWFAWSAGTDNNFQQPHVEMVTMNIDNNNPPHLSVAQQVQIWNNSYAFGYPALATNGCTGEVGMSFEYGGNGNYENHVVGFWGDFIAYITTESNSGSTRFGDYVTIRQTPPTNANPGNLFDAFGYGMNAVPPPGTGANPDPHYVQFGRPASSCVQLQ
jgi:hypothetical protein